MSLLDTLRDAVKIADTVTKPLQTTVLFFKHAGDDAYGDDVFPSTPAQLKAIVEWKQQVVKTQTGELVASRLNLTFLDVAALLAATANGGIKYNDKITLQNGETCPILSLDGFMDPGTGIPVATQVFLG